MRATTAVSVGRSVVGIAMVGRPTWVTRPLGVDAVTSTNVSWLTRMIGGREVGIGLGTLAALRRASRSGGSTRGWMLVSALADTTDVTAIGMALRRRQVNPVVGGAAAGLAAFAAAASLRALITAR